MYNSLKEALQIIGEVNMSTTYVPPPPPVKNDWKPPPVSSTPQNTASSHGSSQQQHHVSQRPLPPVNRPTSHAPPAQAFGAQPAFGQAAFGHQQLLPPAPSSGGQRGSKVFPSGGGQPPSGGQVNIPPRPKPNPAAFMDPNQILQPVKAPLRPAPSVPPRR